MKGDSWGRIDGLGHSSDCSFFSFGGSPGDVSEQYARESQVDGQIPLYVSAGSGNNKILCLKRLQTNKILRKEAGDEISP